MDTTRLLEILKWLVVVLIGEAAMWFLIWLGQDVALPDDPNALYRSLIWKHCYMILAVIGTSGAASAINWITKHDWWDQLEAGNVAVGIATAGLFIGVGFAISGAM